MILPNTGVNEFYIWMKVKYPKLYYHIIVLDDISITAFCVERGMHSKFYIYNRRVWEITKDFIIDNEHLHDLWIL